MAKTRVHELAKEFGVESKFVLEKLKEMGEFVKSASSTVEPPVEMIASAMDDIGELPSARIRRLEAEIGFDLAEGLVASGRDSLYERVSGDRRTVANVVMNPLAATGVRLLAQLAFGFEQRPDVRYGLTALCIGLGMGAALLWENARHG